MCIMCIAEENKCYDVHMSHLYSLSFFGAVLAILFNYFPATLVIGLASGAVFGFLASGFDIKELI